MNVPDPSMHTLITTISIPENTLSTVQKEDVANLLEGKDI